MRSDVTLRLGFPNLVIPIFGQQYAYQIGRPTITGATSGSLHPNEPVGATPAIDTGIIRVAPSQVSNGIWTTSNNGVTNTWTNFTSTGGLPRNPAAGATGPGTQSPQQFGFGNFANKISLCPDSGWRQQYDTTLPGGYNAVSFGTALRNGAVNIYGTGAIYVSMFVRYINWNNIGAAGQQIVGMKLAEPRCGGTTVGDTLTNSKCNHVFNTNNNNSPSSSDIYAVFTKQINVTPEDAQNYVRRDVSPFSENNLLTPNANLFQLNQQYIQVEFLINQELTSGSTGARVRYWVNQQACYDSATLGVGGGNYGPQGAFNLLTPTDVKGWWFLTFNCTYGGANYNNGPVSTMFYDIDRIYASTFMTTVNAVGQQYGYGTATGIVESDIAITPDGQQINWQLGTITLNIINSINVNINPTSQSYQYQFGVITLQLTTNVIAIGQQYAYQLGSPTIQTSKDVSVTPTGQQYNYQFGTPGLQIANGSTPSPIVIIPVPGEIFTIEPCPKSDTMMTIESSCGQVTTPQTYIYNGTLTYDGTHAYGAY